MSKLAAFTTARTLAVHHLAAPCAFCGMKNAPREAVIDAVDLGLAKLVVEVIAQDRIRPARAAPPSKTARA